MAVAASALVRRGGAGPQQLWLAAKCVGGAGGLAAVVGYSADEGFRRAVQFNYEVLPIALHYKAVELYTRGWDEDAASRAFAQLHAKYAPRSLEIVLRQKGFYVKTAQFLSQYPNVVPEEYIEAFKILRDDAPAMPFARVKRIVEDELGAPLNKVFLHFDAKPVGAASIGQVHSARLLSGQEVVVKVQYPEAERQFNIDVDLSIRLSRILAPHYVDILRQLKKTFASEFDYRREAQLQREARDRLRGNRDVVVPLPFDGEHPASRACGHALVTKHVFTMERLRGKPVDKWAAEQVLDMALREGRPAQEVLERLQALSPAEIERLVPSERALRACNLALDLRDAIRNAVAVSYNWTLGWVGTPIAVLRSPRPLNVHQVADRLFKVQAQCIFEEGFLNCDPHAGNVLLLEDGRLGLIDWGQVARLSESQRLHFARAVLAVADRDEPLIAHFAQEMGVRTQRQNQWVAMKLGTFWLGSFGEDVVGELGGATAFEQNLARIDPLVATGDEYFAAVRCVMMTRGVAALIGLPFTDSAVRLRPAAEACLRRAGARLETLPGRRLPRPDLQALLGLPAPRRAAAAAEARA